ncbi:MAG: STAS domain-containing protein [Prevotella sp.]|nr:STAS domain-containing protein [Prevotella sp.]
MKTTFKEENNDYVMYFEGRLDTAAAPETEKEIQPLMNCDNHNIILDCTALEYISSSGLRIFLSILKNAKAKGSHVYIRGISDSIRKVFTMTGFYNLFEFK